ncbi:hypothetical protein IFR04_010882 [Cadophora malorum]|uniref:Uncharacterized protein n=1 Tax=Cadophora malorum TaxID=108018 RepID=A0A8H7TBB5_9HELO|nr:hypothetical protein IFR04_010882 [Cadophora malorum]
MQFLRALLPLVAVLPPSLENPLRTAQSTDNGVVSPSTTFSSDAIARPKYNETAKVLFWNDVDFKGDKKHYQVIDDKCYNLPKTLMNYVVSAKLEPKIWYCTFFPQENCEAEDESDEVHQLPAGEYDFLFPEGIDFVSFKCKLYKKRLESALAHAGSISPSDSLDPQPHASEFATSLKTMLSPFEIEVFILPRLSGPSSIMEFLPGSPACRLLTSHTETAFRSIAMGNALKICITFEQPDCEGPIFNEIFSTTEFLPPSRLGLKSIKCSTDYSAWATEDPSTKSLTPAISNNFVPSVKLYLYPDYNGPVSDIPYYPGTWGCVPLQEPEEYAFHSIEMSPEFRSCKFYPDMACHGNVLLEIQESTRFVPGDGNFAYQDYVLLFRRISNCIGKITEVASQALAEQLRQKRWTIAAAGAHMPFM